ncbi:MAG: RNA polymerase sigma factor [Ignavibacteria bacterium]|nr:RNA polymerase sigma factor [Ignavibacteria bacterium]
MNSDLKNIKDEQLFLLMAKEDKLSFLAFEELYNRYSSKIYTYIRKILNNSPASDDIFQETFIRFYEFSKKSKNMTNVIGFLIKTARNLCLNEKKSKNSTHLDISNFNFAYYDKSYENKEINELVDIGLDALPEKYREVLVLREFMDFSYQEIADILGVSMPVVRIRIFRAKNKLREFLAPFLNENEKNKIGKIK